MDNEQQTEQQYGDIIGLDRPQFSSRPKMSLHDRAAQFAPFAALVGYDDEISKTGQAHIKDEENKITYDAFDEC